MNEITEPTGEDLARAAAEVLSELITVPVQYVDSFAQQGPGTISIPAMALRITPAPQPERVSNISPVILRCADAQTIVRTLCMHQLKLIAREINSEAAPVTTFDLEVPHGLLKSGRAEVNGIACRCVYGYEIHEDQFLMRFDVLYARTQELAAAA